VCETSFAFWAPLQKVGNIRARSTRLADPVGDCAIDIDFAVSSSPCTNSIARGHAAMTFNPFLAGCDLYRNPTSRRESLHYHNFMESIVWHGSSRPGRPRDDRSAV
jgi:hypothetical protein